MRKRWFSLDSGEELTHEQVARHAFIKALVLSDDGFAELLMSGLDERGDSYWDIDLGACERILRAAGWTVEPPKSEQPSPYSE